MKILYFHQYFSTPEGSTGLRSYHMANALARYGHEVIIITGSYDRAETSCQSFDEANSRFNGKITVVCLPISASNKDGFLKRIATFLWYAFWAAIVGLRYPSDLVIATSTPLTAAIPGIFIKKMMQIPFIFEARDLWPAAAIEMGSLTNPVLIKISQWLEKYTYRQANSCIALAPGIISAMKKRGGKNIHFIPNGASADHGIKKTTTQLRESESPFAIYTGTLGKANNPRLLAEVCRELHRKGRPDITVTIMGDGSEKKWLVNMKEERSLTNLRLQEPVAHSKLKKYHSQAFAGLLVMQDIKVFRQSTSPNKFFDYLAAGLPVVCSYDGWMAKLIKEYKCGLVIGNQDAEEFANALIYLFDNEDERKKMSDNVRILLNEHFDIKKLQQKFVAAVNKYEGIT